MITTLALVVVITYVGVAFGLRAVQQLRRTGDHGFRGISGAPGSAAWFAGVGFVAAIALGLAGPAADLVGAPRLDVLDVDGVRVTGLVIGAAGLIAALAAQKAMGDSWRVGVADGESTSLVDAGVFALVRNPFFTATVVMATGLALAIPNLVAAVGLIATVVAVNLQVRVVEEPYLRATHGSEWDRYAARVGRFLPRRRSAVTEV